MSVTPQDIQKCVDVALEFGATRLILFGAALEEPETARDIDVLETGRVLDARQSVAEHT